MNVVYMSMMTLFFRFCGIAIVVYLERCDSVDLYVAPLILSLYCAYCVFSCIQR